MEIIKAKDFESRIELEGYISSKYGTDHSLNKGNILIRGTREELEVLKLSDVRTIYGVPCEITDLPTEFKKQVEVIARGEKFESGINLGKKKK